LLAIFAIFQELISHFYAYNLWVTAWKSIYDIPKFKNIWDICSGCPTTSDVTCNGCSVSHRQNH